MRGLFTPGWDRESRMREEPYPDFIQWVGKKAERHSRAHTMGGRRDAQDQKGGLEHPSLGESGT